jgi:hypothetical protein
MNTPTALAAGHTKPGAREPLLPDQWGHAIVDRRPEKGGQRVIETDIHGQKWELQRIEKPLRTAIGGTTSLYKVVGLYVPSAPSANLACGHRTTTKKAAMLAELERCFV